MQQNMMPMEGNSFLDDSETEVLYNKFIDSVKRRNAAVAMVKSTIKRGFFATERERDIGTRARYFSQLRWCTLTRIRINFANECLEIVAECAADVIIAVAKRATSTVTALEASNDAAYLNIMEIASTVSDTASFTARERLFVATVRTLEDTSIENNVDNLTVMENTSNEVTVPTIQAPSTENDAANLATIENISNEATVSTIDATSTENDAASINTMEDISDEAIVFTSESASIENDAANFNLMENTSNEDIFSTDENTPNSFETADIITMENTLKPRNTTNPSAVGIASTISNKANLTTMEIPSTLSYAANILMMENTSTVDTVSTNETSSTENNAANLSYMEDLAAVVNTNEFPDMEFTSADSIASSFTIKEATSASTNAAVIAAAVADEKSSASYVAFSGTDEAIVDAIVSNLEQNQMEIVSDAKDEKENDIKNCVQISSKKRKYQNADESESESNNLQKRINIERI